MFPSYLTIVKPCAETYDVNVLMILIVTLQTVKLEEE